MEVAPAVTQGGTSWGGSAAGSDGEAVKKMELLNGDSIGIKLAIINDGGEQHSKYPN